MSQQYRSRASRNRNSRGSNPRFSSSTSSTKSRRTPSQGQAVSGQNQSQLAKLEDEYHPPFSLNCDWKADERYKLKIPHPHIADEKETVEFPILSSPDATFSDRALFYKQVLDIQEQVQFDGNDGPNLYYTFTRCLRGEPLSEWQDLMDDRGTTAANRSPANYSDDIDSFIRRHETRDNEELLQAQLNYMNHLVKPRKMQPTKFKAALSKLNRRISLIPEAEDTDRLDDTRLKSIFYSAMPSAWRKEFKKVGKKIKDESLDELATFFDLFFEPEATSTTRTTSSTASHRNSSTFEGNSNRSTSKNVSRSGRRPNDDDECPIHGGHKWKDCFDNKFGSKYRPPRPSSEQNRTSNTRSENHMNEPTSDSSRPNSHIQTTRIVSENVLENQVGSSSTQDSNPYGDDFKDNGLGDEPVPQAIVEGRQGDTIFIGQALLDSGGSKSLIAKSRIPKYVKVTTLSKKYKAVSAGGPVTHVELVKFDRICFPQFEMEVWRADAEFIVFEDHGHSSYDLVIGRDILQPLGFEFSFADQTVRWMNVTIPFVPREQKPNIPDSERIHQVISSFMQESDYNTSTTGDDIAQEQVHLPKEERNLLGLTLGEFNPMFNQVLGCYPHAKCDLKLKTGTDPIHTRPFQVPDKFRDLLKNELNKLVDLKVLKPVLSSAWAFPTFLIPKKDNTARLVSDFRRLNLVLEDSQFPLPMIKDVLTRRQGFNYVTCLDLTSQFYHFELTDKAKEYCTITTPFGLYRYNRLPMGVKNSPAFAQSVMVHILQRFDDVEVFIDDIAIFTTGTFEDHCNMIAAVLKVIMDNGFSIKPKKCFWAKDSVEYLGHIIETDGVRPQPKKVEAILKLDHPRTPKQLRSFIGMVNYYRDFVRQRAHILQPLTAQTKEKRKIVWNDACQDAFDKIKSSLAQDCMLYYPNPNLPFIIEPDASDYQLGSIVLQNNVELPEENILKLFTSSPSTAPEKFRPVAYFSRKLTRPQKNYTTLEKELLSIVETLIEYRTFLFGRKVYVFSDHRNLTFTNLRSQRALRWRLIAEEFNITIIHRSGDSNTAADALSRLPLMDTDVPSSVRQAEERFMDAYLFYPVQNHMHSLYPMNFKKLEEVQLNDAQLLTICQQKPKKYKAIATGEYNLIHHLSDEQPPKWKIVIPVSHINPVLEWFHRVLNHPGATRMYRTMGIHFYFPNMKSIVEDYCKTCDICQRIKGPFPKFGQLPMKSAESNPWEEVQVDLIGPWMFKFAKWQITVNALTVIDPFIGVCEMARLKNKTCAHVATKFYQIWLARYPRPLRCIHDNGEEFIRQEFQDTLKHYGIQDVPTTVKNPQANSIIERMHLTAGSIFRSMVTEAEQNGRHLISSDIEDFVDTAISSAQYAINATVHSITRETPGAFIYQRDMMLPIQNIANWESVRLKKQHQMERNYMRENKSRKPFDWQPGMEIMLEEQTRYKLNPKATGPYTIELVHTNGTVTIRKKPNVFEKVNIRRIKPYYRRANNNQHAHQRRQNQYFHDHYKSTNNSHHCRKCPARHPPKKR